MADTEVTIKNARDISDDLFSRGFALRSAPTSLKRDDFLVHERVSTTHFAECEAILKSLGASHVLPFDYIVRSVEQQGKAQVAGGQGVQGVAAGIHADYSINGAPRRLQQL